MSYLCNPPSFDEATGQFVGDFQVETRDVKRGSNQLTFNPEDYNEDAYNQAINPAYSRQAIQAQLPIFNENASDEAVVAFWRRSEPLTDAEIDALQSAYVATDNVDIANLLAWKLTGDISQLSDEQRYQLGIDETSDEDLVPMNEGDFPEEDIIAFEGWLAENASEPDPETAQLILQADMGNTDAAMAIQHLSYQYFNGNLSLEDAYSEALSTGLPEAQLYEAFQQLYTLINTPN